MKVEFTSAAAVQLPTERSVKPVSDTSVANTTAATTDRTTLHADQTVQSLVTRALQQPEVRQPAVEALRQSVNSGSYHTDASQTADAIISHES